MSDYILVIPDDSTTVGESLYTHLEVDYTLDLSDTSTVTDSESYQFMNQLFTDTATVSEGLAKLTAKTPLSDSATVTSSVANLTSRSVSDTSTVTSSVTKLAQKLGVDTATASDLVRKLAGKNCPDTATVTSTIAGIKVLFFVKYFKTDATNAESTIQTYLNDNVDVGNLKHIELTPISSTNFGVLIVHT